MTTIRPTLRSAGDLVAAGLITTDAREMAERVGKRYAVAITPQMSALIDRADPDDPIARQFVPDSRELTVHPAEIADPIGDDAKSPVRGLVHRYPDRVLLKVVGICPVYCRFCFRREMVGPAGRNLTHAEIATALDYVRVRPKINEVIVTGGDPFMLSPQRVRTLTEAVAEIAHVDVIRWHTRVPVVAPDRITPEFVAALRVSRLAVFVGLHCNHPRELTVAAGDAIARIIDAGVPIVSQTVLLQGVNDDVGTLEALMRAFIARRIKPYYLHHGDLAPGTAHFRTTIAHGADLIEGLRQRLSGLAMPTYMLDIPGAHGKVPASPGYVTSADDQDGYVVRTPRGDIIFYEDERKPTGRRRRLTAPSHIE